MATVVVPDVVDVLDVVELWPDVTDEFAIAVASVDSAAKVQPARTKASRSDPNTAFAANRESLQCVSDRSAARAA